MQTTPNGRIDTSTNPEIWSQIVLRLPKSLESEFVNSLREDIEPQVKLTLHGGLIDSLVLTVNLKIINFMSIDFILILMFIRHC